MAFDNLHLEKGMYREAGKSFTQVLEALDPSENYKGTALEGTDAFQRQLKRFGIRVRGAGSDRVEKFFRTAASAVLFPEYVSRAVRQGMEEDDILPSLVATTTVIDALDYRVVCSEPGENDMELARVAEGAEIPSTRITVSDQLTRLYKRGRMVEASYEALRFQKLDLFSVFLRQIGSSIQNAHIHDAIEVLTEGSGNVSPEILYAGETEIGGSAEALSYDQLIRFWTKFRPYKLNAIVAPESLTQQLLMLSQMQDASAGLAFHGTGKMITPFGAQLLPISDEQLGERLIGLDNRYALEMVRCGEVSVEFDKLIDHQLERAAITSIAGFDLICDGAVKVLEYEA